LCLLGPGVVMKTLIALMLLLTACTTPEATPVQERFLSQEQDEELRQRCEATGCAIVPIPVWREVLRRLQGQGV
jgi:hypothetical protein